MHFLGNRIVVSVINSYVNALSELFFHLFVRLYDIRRSILLNVSQLQHTYQLFG